LGLATVAGVAVSNIFLNQPLLNDLRVSFPDQSSYIGTVPAATKFGYALGMLFLAPLGDRLERSRLILIQLIFLFGGLAAAAGAVNLPMMALASLVIVIAAIITQQAVPFAA
jgi:predicted MFS family arabinose efflux permease